MPFEWKLCHCFLIGETLDTAQLYAKSQAVRVAQRPCPPGPLGARMSAVTNLSQMPPIHTVAVVLPLTRCTKRMLAVWQTNLMHALLAGVEEFREERAASSTHWLSSSPLSKAHLYTAPSTAQRIPPQDFLMTCSGVQQGVAC